VGRGFDPAILDALDVGDSARLGRAVVPVYDDGGQVYVGFVSRAVTPACGACGRHHGPAEGCTAGQPRWSFPRNFAKGEWLYNLAAARSSTSAFVLLVEGVPDVLRAAEAGVPAVACFGTDLSVAQTRKLAALRRYVLVAFDNDEAGRRTAAVLAPVLRREGLRAGVRHPPDGFKDIGEMGADDVKLWLADILPGRDLSKANRLDPERRAAV
jgi:hypothetical protein